MQQNFCPIKKTKWLVGSFVLFLSLTVVTGCSHPHRKLIKLPPVREGWQESAAGKNAYVVQKKDTLYSIAWAFGLDYRDLAKRNNISSPYFLRSGQRLYIVSSKTTKNNFSLRPLFVRDKTNIRPLKGWSWPARGTIVTRFDSNLVGNRGIDIKGKHDDPIFASNSGKVVYSGTGIRSYGKLIIIKHNDDYLSAYAYNKTMLVHEGQTVIAGQKIATMGNDDAGNVRLHFEIRQIGKPIDPLLYLPKKP
ncbi:lipoprotein NlpD [Gammaproteobacteria bacterium]